MLTIISVNSPRRFDEEMTDGLMTMAEHGQPAVVTPFTLMGAMTPVTLAAALVQQNAEALAGIALTQLVRAGAPVVYGAFTSNVDLRSGAPAFGTPENARATIAAGQLARRYGIPYRASNASASNALDAQAAYESADVDLVVGARRRPPRLPRRRLDGGRADGVVREDRARRRDAADDRAHDRARRRVDEAEVRAGSTAIADVPTGGHFFGSPHTLERYESAFYEPLVSDWQNYENWEDAGARTAEERATAVWQEALERYEQPPLDDDVAARLDEYVDPAPRRARARRGGSREDPLRPQRARGRPDGGAPRRLRGRPRADRARSRAAGSRASPTRQPTGSTPTCSSSPARPTRGRRTTGPRSSATSPGLRAFDGPVLGICAGMQNLVRALGGTIGPSATPAHGFAPVEVVDSNGLLLPLLRLDRRCASATTTR